MSTIPVAGPSTSENIGGIMIDDFLALAPETSVQTAVQILQGSRLGALPVLDDTGHLMGLLHALDCISPTPGRGAACGVPIFFHVADGGASLHGDLRPITLSTRVEDLMVREVACVTRDTALSDALGLLLERPDAPLVVLENARVVGLVSSAVLVRALWQRTHSSADEAQRLASGAVVHSLSRQDAGLASTSIRA